MPFEIDTGTPDPALQFIPDWFLDTYRGEPPETARVVHDYAYHLMGAMRQENPAAPKTIATVRKHTLSAWGFLRTLADMHPEVFDEFWTSYAERVLA